jgi:virginiamycin B lyase
MRLLPTILAAAVLAFSPDSRAVEVTSFAVPEYAHDVAPAPDGGVWFTAQGAGALGRLDPATSKVTLFPLGDGSAPHGVIIGPDNAPWITDGGQDAILRVDPVTHAVSRFALPQSRDRANLNTLTFDRAGVVWFTGQNGIYGRCDPKSGKVEVWPAPRGVGPYGINTAPSGEVYFVSLAGSYLAQLNRADATVRVLEPPTHDAGTRRIWPDSKGQLWISEWNGGNLDRFDPAGGTWDHWRPPGDRPRLYAVYVDETDKVWVSDWGTQQVLRFDPATGKFAAFTAPHARGDADVRQLNGRKGEVWAPESGTNKLVRYKFE